MCEDIKLFPSVSKIKEELIEYTVEEIDTNGDDDIKKDEIEEELCPETSLNRFLKSEVTIEEDIKHDPPYELECGSVYDTSKYDKHAAGLGYSDSVLLKSLLQMSNGRRRAKTSTERSRELRARRALLKKQQREGHPAEVPAKSIKQKSVKQESVKQKSVKQKSLEQESVEQESVKQESVIQESVIQESVIQESVIQESVIQDFVIQELDVPESESSELAIMGKKAKSAQATRREKRTALNGVPRKKDKSAAERMRRYRLRKKAKMVFEHLHRSRFAN
ncbi:uncharacterized protein LOC113365396 [Ctenocephalides felis]|uniref:uncharacterized protein LOC113365396 n=1 Tax=Ctenocephalides felis TaxID=7515 RepID=UPI000E6E2EE9|nr:uncharacterized protein LOC113365396 [Ctenocephalides felis]